MSDVIKKGQKPQAAKKENGFSEGSVISSILELALLMTLTQLINVLYNAVDRVYTGMTPKNATLFLTGLGPCPPIISMAIVSVSLPGMDGAPLCSIEKGGG